MIAAVGAMGQIGAILEVTVRALVNRRRTLLMLLLASAPVLIALLIRVAGRPVDPERLAGNILDGLVLRTVLPLIALVFGTAALGSELEDGTATFLFTKPVPRWKIVLAKWFGAAALTTALVVPAAVIAGVLIAGDQGGGLGLTLAAAVACVVGDRVLHRGLRRPQRSDVAVARAGARLRADLGGRARGVVRGHPDLQHPPVRAGGLGFA